VSAPVRVSRSSGRGKSGLKYLIGLGVILAAIVWIVSSGLRDNLVFFITPSEYMKDTARYENRVVRLGGVVEPGTVNLNKETLELRFIVSDGIAQLPVVHQGTPPDMFEEGMGVTIEGKFEGETFRGDTLLVKHSEEYRAPKPGEKIDYEKLIRDTKG
jgi:cytochrome c-type biogenesis protein CcmE